MRLLAFNLNHDKQLDSRSLRGLFAFAALQFVMMATPASSCDAAQVQFSPDDEVVQNVAEKAVKGLEKAMHETSGQLALGALAIVQAGKRYTESVPRDSPTVQKAVKQILADLPKGSDKKKGPIAGNNETYYPAVALILLCEVDDQKYESQIKLLIEILLERQRQSGAFTYNSDKDGGDTSQMQYAALAMFVADQHQFEIDPQASKAALTWLTGTQQQDGTFRYKISAPTPSAPRGRPTRNSPAANPSIQSAGLGTVYLLADMLQLSTRKKKTAVTSEELERLAFPPGVSIYVKPRDDGAKAKRKGPLVNFDRGRLGGSRNAGNKVMEQMFEIPARTWNYYYMYAFERYAYFRAETEGNMGRGKMKRWYDQGVQFLMDEQKSSGMFPAGSNSLETAYVSTSFAILFLVRSSEILVRPAADGELSGGQGFPTDTQLTDVNGTIQSNSAQQDLGKQLELLKSGSLDESDLRVLAKSMRKALNSFRSDEKNNRGNLESFLRTMISDRDYYRRLIAVRFLAGEQDLENVPALLYALGDPDYRIAYEAHNGLRLVSRKIDSITLDRIAVPPFPNDQKVRDQIKLEYLRVKDRWTDWFLKLKPNAKLLD